MVVDFTRNGEHLDYVFLQVFDIDDDIGVLVRTRTQVDQAYIVVGTVAEEDYAEKLPFTIRMDGYDMEYTFTYEGGEGSNMRWTMNPQPLQY